jgi:ATP-dependent DNA helicase RecG
VRQSGLQAFRFARLPEDFEWLASARRHASDILAADPALAAPEHALLEDALQRAFGAEAQAPIPA